jgi:hypothetical protein
MPRAILVIAATGAVILGAAGWAVGSSDVSSPQTIHSVFVGTESGAFDEPPSGPSLGDTEVTSGRLMVGGKVAGRVGFSCTQHRGYVVCEGAGNVSGGQLSFSGISWNDTSKHVWAITGGTQNYDNARGTIHITDVSPTRSRLSVEILP